MSDITGINVNVESPIRKIEQKNILDLRTFVPHQVKEVEEWSWRKAKNEKWFVMVDCVTGKLKKWKLNSPSDDHLKLHE